MIRRLLPTLACCAIAATHAENEIGFIEKFALSLNRAAVLEELTPGTEDYFFYRALHFQNTSQTSKLKATLAQWAQRWPESERRNVIENRAALLGYDADPQATLKFLRDRLGVPLADTSRAPDQRPDLPSRLDPEHIKRAVFLNAALEDDDLGKLDNGALSDLIREKVKLRPAQVAALLSRLTRPDLPGLVELIAQDLKREDSGGFGEREIHHKLLPAQLDALARLEPTLRENEQWVLAWLATMRPSADSDMESNVAEREAWLDRTWAFVKSLAPSFNTLKAQLLNVRLQHDRTRGVYDKARFVEFLKLPRQADYVNPRRSTDFAADSEADRPDALASNLPRCTDESLIRDYLLALLPAEPTWTPWAVWLSDSYIKPIFAEAKLVNGIGDAAKWAALITPEEFAALKDRVDVDFAPNHPPILAPGDDVALTLFLKNTPQIIVRTYEINSLSYFLDQKRPLDTAVKLDGLAPTREETVNVDEPPLKRTSHVFKFPDLKNRRGAWIIEFVGGGKASRALIRKGQWQLLQQSGPAGELLTVLDEKHRVVRDATAWLDGRKFEADAKTGFIAVPFAKNSEDESLVIADATGEFAMLTAFRHHNEAYRFDVQFHIEREQLLAGRDATLALRSALFVNDAQIPLRLLREAKLTITTTTRDHISNTTVVNDVGLSPEKLFVHKFTVPDRLGSLTTKLTAQIEKLSLGGEKETLEASRSWTLNGIDDTAATSDGRFSQFGERVVFELLGKNGEPVPDTVVEFHFNHQGFENEVDEPLVTNERGRIDLGPLDGIESVRADTPGERVAECHFRGDPKPVETIHARAGDTVQLAWTESHPPRPGDVSLLETRGDSYVADFSKAVALVHGFLEIKGLPPGDYSLRAAGLETTIRIAAGDQTGRWIAGAARTLEVRDPPPLQIENVVLKPESVIVQLRNVGPYTRVHVAATRFLAHGSIMENLGGFERMGPASSTPPRTPTIFVSGRAIGDESRYILERRYAKAYAGIQLPRPGLLLAPWEKRSTDTSPTTLSWAEAPAATPAEAKPEAQASPDALSVMSPEGSEDEDGQNLDFLALPSVTLYNLKPDKDGVVRIDRNALGDRQNVQVYAEDLHGAVSRTVAYPEVPTKLRDLRLPASLDPKSAFTEKKEVSVLKAGESLTVTDTLASETETYDTLASIHKLFATLSSNATLMKFAWLLQWPSLNEAERRAKYSEFACHELNFFLSRKDPAFFEKVVQPNLRNKKDRTFMDDYLLNADLNAYLEPWRYARLNVAERALLAQRLPAQHSSTARHLREWWETQPDDAARQDRLFETALLGRALDASDPRQVPPIVGLHARLAFLAPADDAITSLASDVKSQVSAGVTFAWMAPGDPLAKRKIAGGAGGRDEAPIARGFGRDGTRDETDRLGRQVATNGGNKLGELTDHFFADVEGIESESLRLAVRPYFRALGPTKEWAENNYFQLPIAAQDSSLITINAFWRDFAAWEGKTPFLSPNIAEASHNFSEMMLALAVIDLPFTAAKHQAQKIGDLFTFVAGSPVIVFKKQIATAEPAPDKIDFLVSEHFFRQDDRYREVDGEKVDHYVTEEFLAGVVYGSQAVVTNPGSSRRKLSVLIQIPQGSIPVSGSKTTQSREFLLEPFTTATFESAFYFPAPSQESFTHTPAQVASGGRAAGKAKALSFKVVRHPSTADKTSWTYISQSAAESEVLAFLADRNLGNLPLEQLAWRCAASAVFFRNLIALLESRHVYSEANYRYSLVHNERSALREWLRHQEEFLSQCGPFLASSIITIDPIERRTYEHLEYAPLINQRAHRVGTEHRIANPVIRAQYQDLLAIIAHKAALDTADEMSVVYYLFLQDRTEEALARLRAIKPDSVPTQLQFDYFRCVAAIEEERLADARGIAAQYSDYPVDRWRTLFQEVSAQLDEINGRADAQRGGAPDREQQQAAHAASDPSFDFKVDNKTILLTWNNLREVSINYHLMDPEFLFSASPFANGNSNRLSIVQPAKATLIPLPEGQSTLALPLPDEFTQSDVLVEILGAGHRTARAYHANTFKLLISENYGRLEVRDEASGAPLPRAYVKMYARLKNGTVRFFKDGYTDLRGRFDFASLNGSETPAREPVPAKESAPRGFQMLQPNELSEIARFSILVLSETHGAEVREASPPNE